MNDVLQGIAKVFEPSLGTSVIKTFRVLFGIILTLCWLICLPVELILHRRIGKRYSNTVFVIVAYLLLNFSVAVVGVVAFDLIRPMSAHASPATLSPNDPTMLRIALALMPFNWFYLAAFVAFVCHYVGNRRRFGTPEQGHSLDPGIPWIVYPPKFVVALVLDNESSTELALQPDQPMNGRAGSPPRWLNSPLAAPIRHILACGRAHIADLRAGKHPYGPVTWWACVLVEPALLIVGGIGIAIQAPVFLGFGVYLGIVGGAMWVKGRIWAADWRDRVYADVDQRLEAEAMQNIRRHVPATEVSEVFTVPVTGAVLPPVGRGPGGPGGPIAAEPVMVGPGFEELVKPQVGGNRDEKAEDQRPAA